MSVQAARPSRHHVWRISLRTLATSWDDSIFSESAQAWFVKQFGPGVNLGNIPPEEVIALETLRLGLRSDTLKEVLLGERAGTPAS